MEKPSPKGPNTSQIDVIMPTRPILLLFCALARGEEDKELICCWCFFVGNCVHAGFISIDFNCTEVTFNIMILPT